MECEVISFTKNLLHGDDNCKGITTTGGSESVFYGILSHKRYFFREFGIEHPEVVMPESVHPAFYKACEYLDVKYNAIKCNHKSGEVDMEKYERMINKNTICLIGSNPNLPFGTVDPLAEISKLAGKYNKGFFIDGCMGSMLNGFTGDLKINTGEVYNDLRIQNVTAFSFDTHKYGLSPKGISVLLFPNPEIMKALFFGIKNWVGGLYATPAIQGSRAGHTIAAAWAVMMHHGYNGYCKMAKKVFRMTDYVVDEIKKIDDLQIVGNPKLGNVSIIATNAKKIDMYKIGNLMEKKGWFLGTTAGEITSLTCTIHENNCDQMPTLIEDLKSSLETFKKDGVQIDDGYFKVYGDCKGIPSFIVKRVSQNIIEEHFNIDLFKKDGKEKTE